MVLLSIPKTIAEWNPTFQSTEWWLKGGWMATEQWREMRFSVAFQSPFRDHSVDWMAGTFQWPFSHFFFWKRKLRTTWLELRKWESKGEYSNHSATETVKTVDEHIVYIYHSLNLYFDLVFLIIYSFINYQLLFTKNMNISFKRTHSLNRFYQTRHQNLKSKFSAI